MPLRPQALSRCIRTTCPHARSRPQQSCLSIPRNAPTRQPCPITLQILFFHTTAHYRSDSAPTHYETLQLTQAASPAEIKRQFFTLSKKYHPDKNPNDPTASTRFVEISEAYHVLSVPDKRAQYDASLDSSRGSRSRWGMGDAPAHGSYSSASFAGSRPATGLNKKRTTFRGPPPSFYKSGGYGRHSAKRAEYAHHNPHASGEQAAGEAGQESYGDFGSGFGPGQSGQGSEVPHFDDRRHKQTHDHVNEHIYARRRRHRAREIPDELDRSGTLINFLVVSGVLAAIGFAGKIMGDRMEDGKRRKDGPL